MRKIPNHKSQIPGEKLQISCFKFKNFFLGFACLGFGIFLTGCSTLQSMGDSVQLSGSSALAQIEMIRKGVGDTVEFTKAQAEKAKKELEALQQKTQKAADGAGKIMEGTNLLKEVVK